MRAADDARAAGVASQRGEADRVLAGTALQSELVEIFRRDAREQRNGEYEGRFDGELRRPLTRRLDGGAHHVEAAQRVHVQDAYVGAHELRDGSRHGTRDVVELSIHERSHVAGLAIG